MRWLGTPLLRLSALLHGVALLLLAWRPMLWPWLLALVVANHLLLMGLGLWPRSRALGANFTRLPPAAAARNEVAITIDDGPDPEVTPLVLQLLAQHGVRATFFCIGQQVEQHPQLVREMVSAGHEVANHSQRHPLYFSLLGPARIRREIEAAQRVITAAGAAPPRFFRAPAGLRNLLLQPVLQQLGLQLVSWTRRGFDTVNGNGESVLAALTRNLRSGDILLLHDAHAARTTAGTPVIVTVLPRLLAVLQQAGLRPVTLRAAFE